MKNEKSPRTSKDHAVRISLNKSTIRSLSARTGVCAGVMNTTPTYCLVGFRGCQQN